MFFQSMLYFKSQENDGQESRPGQEEISQKVSVIATAYEVTQRG